MTLESKENLYYDQSKTVNPCLFVWETSKNTPIHEEFTSASTSEEIKTSSIHAWFYYHTYSSECLYAQLIHD